jgi:hypothetical protein
MPAQGNHELHQLIEIYARNLAEIDWHLEHNDLKTLIEIRKAQKKDLKKLIDRQEAT